MSTIYFDNFRGFERTFLNLKEVNFFVGENSTGKTSILKLIAIIASQGFWRYGEFGKDEISLGSFDEIASSQNDRKEYFDIGYFEPGSANASREFAIKLRYIENNKLPFIKEIGFKNEFINIQIIIEGKLLKYRFRLIDQVDKRFEFKFEEWLKNNGLNDSVFEKVEWQSFGIIPIITQLTNQITLTYLIGSTSTTIPKSIEFQLPKFVTKLAWMAPVRAEPLPTYRNSGLVFNSDGRHSPSVLKEIFNPEVRHILNKFGADSGLFENIMTKDLIDSEIIELLKDRGIDEIKEQFAKSDIFEIRVTINQQSRNIVNVGYGISQVLPILIEAIAREDETWFATQQPEIHLHPRAQAALGDFYFKCHTEDRQKFIIETHSDYIIDRFRFRLNRALKEGKNEKGISQVVFFSKSNKGNQLETIEFNEDGSYSDEQPAAFRSFFIREQLELISM